MFKLYSIVLFVYYSTYILFTYLFQHSLTENIYKFNTIENSYSIVIMYATNDLDCFNIV